MRQLRRLPARPQTGMTLVELMVGLAIAAILLMAAAPAFSDFIANSRLREAGNLLYAQALLAQSEAIKRNSVVRLSTSGSTIDVIDFTDPDDPVLLFTRRLADGTSATAADIDFTGEGRTVDFEAGSVDITASQFSCSTQIRCPGLRVDGGGAIRTCSDHTATC